MRIWHILPTGNSVLFGNIANKACFETRY